jgi:hypothetical protein
MNAAPVLRPRGPGRDKDQGILTETSLEFSTTVVGEGSDFDQGLTDLDSASWGQALGRNG